MQLRIPHFEWFLLKSDNSNHKTCLAGPPHSEILYLSEITKCRDPPNKKRHDFFWIKFVNSGHSIGRKKNRRSLNGFISARIISFAHCNEMNYFLNEIHSFMPMCFQKIYFSLPHLWQFSWIFCRNKNSLVLSHRKNPIYV